MKCPCTHSAALEDLRQPKPPPSPNEAPAAVVRFIPQSSPSCKTAVNRDVMKPMLIAQSAAPFYKTLVKVYFRASAHPPVSYSSELSHITQQPLQSPFQADHHQSYLSETDCSVKVRHHLISLLLFITPLLLLILLLLSSLQ